MPELTQQYSTAPILTSTFSWSAQRRAEWRRWCWRSEPQRCGCGEVSWGNNCCGHTDKLSWWHYLPPIFDKTNVDARSIVTGDGYNCRAARAHHSTTEGGWCQAPEKMMTGQCSLGASRKQRLFRRSAAFQQAETTANGQIRGCKWLRFPSKCIMKKMHQMGREISW